MQFRLSTLMLLVVAVALGCMGWKLADWMIRAGREMPEPLPYFLIGLAGVLLIILLAVGGRRVVAFCVPTFALTVAGLLLTFGFPPGKPIASLLTLAGIASPVPLFIGSVLFALNSEKPMVWRYALMLPSWFLLGWLLSVFWQGA